jgi:vitellogenic carboxypeptidase-like protein
MFTLVGLLSLGFLCRGDTDRPYSLLGVSGYAGSITIDNSTSTSYFYWLFEKIDGNIFSDRAPLIIWLDGGPGDASEPVIIQSGMSTPFYFDDNGVLQRSFNLSWISFYHLIAIDNPIGAGYSFTNSESEIPSTLDQYSTQLYTFLQIIARKYPSWLNRDIYIFGESAGGTWSPKIAYKILMENLSVNITGNIFIKLKGIGLGDPFIDLRYQFVQHSEIAYQIGLINQIQSQEVLGSENLLIQELNNFDYGAAWLTGITIFQLIGNMSSISPYNVRGGPVFADDTDTINFMNLASTKQLLNTPSYTYYSFNNTCQTRIYVDFATGVTSLIPFLIENLKVLIYNGQDDLVINTEGIQNLLQNVQWSYMNNFLGSRKAVWNVQGQIAGYVMSYKNLNLVYVLKAGHLVIYNQPEASLDMIRRFIENQGWN